MTTTRTHAPSTRTTETKVAAVAAGLFAISLFMTVAAVNVPHDASDTELLTWWQESANRTSGVVSGLWAIAVAATFAVVINYVRTIAGERSRAWVGFASSMGAAVTAVWLVTGAARGAVGHLVDVMDEPLPGPDTLRTMTALNYMLLGSAGMAVLALTILAISVVVLRSLVLARWVGFLGLGCAVVMLGAVLAQYGAYTTPLGILWALGLAVALWRQRA